MPNAHVERHGVPQLLSLKLYDLYKHGHSASTQGTARHYPLPSFPINLKVQAGMMSLTYILATVFLAGLTFLWQRHSIFRSRSRGCPLPPGPRPLPVLGNLFDIPIYYPWKKFLHWKESYGESSHLRYILLHDTEDTM